MPVFRKWALQVFQFISLLTIGIPLLQGFWASLMAQGVKNPPAMQETWVPSLGQEDLLEKDTATIHSSIFAWKNPRGRGAWAHTHTVTSGYRLYYSSLCSKHLLAFGPNAGAPPTSVKEMNEWRNRPFLVHTKWIRFLGTESSASYWSNSHLNP